MTTERTQTNAEADVRLPGLDQPVRINSTPMPAEVNRDAELTHSPYSTSDKVQWQFACETHKYIREYISSADNKAQWYIAFASAFIAWVNTQKLYTAFWAITWAEWRLLDILSLISIVGLSACVFCSLLTIRPRTKGSKKGIVFFGSIAEHDASNDYLADVMKKNDQEIVMEKLRHVYELAKVCNEKFATLSIAVWSGGIGLAAGILLVLMR